jgi:formate dehydrogenase subunit gamma
MTSTPLGPLAPALPTAAESPHMVRRYVPAQQVIHWIGVISFFTLLLTGLALLVPPLSFLTRGGASGVIHRIGAVAFILLPALYMLRMPRKALELVRESFTYGREEWEWFKRMPGYFLGSTRHLPPQGRLNAGQKLHHAATFMMFNSVAVSGLLMWFAKGQLGPDGLSVVAIVHGASMLGLSVLMVGHVYFTFLYGALSGMVTGKVTEEYARMEHSKWYESLQQETEAAAESTQTRPAE